jgi:hypothetical protein
MINNTNIIAPRDTRRINVDEHYELEYWTKKFGVTSRKLRAIVREVGEMTQAVDVYLAKNRCFTVDVRS